MDDRTVGAKTETPDHALLRDPLALREDRSKFPEVKAKPGSRVRPLVLIVIATLLGLGIYRGATAIRAPKESTTEQQNTAPPPVRVATVGTGDIKVVVTGLGTVTPIANVTVRTQVNGQLLQVGFTEGQLVKKGDFLAQIDPRPFQLAETQFEGQLIHDQGLLDQARVNWSVFKRSSSRTPSPGNKRTTKRFSSPNMKARSKPTKLKLRIRS